MNKKKAISILKKVYHHSNTDYETNYFGAVGYKTDFLTPAEDAILEAANLVPNSFSEQTHDDLLQEFMRLKSDNRLTQKFVAALFLKGLSGNHPRYRQPLMSYWYLNELSEHPFQKSDTKSTCEVCGLPLSSVEDDTHNLFTYHLGHSWNEMPASFISDLKEIATADFPIITADEIMTIRLLLRAISEADNFETPGQLEKRLAKLKLLPKTDKYKRYGILQTLSVIGVLPSRTELDNQKMRSGIVMPLAGWRGELGVDFERASQIFSISFK